MAKQFQQFLDATHKLSKEMHDNLVQFVKDNGGFINMYDDTGKDTPYGFVMDEYYGENRERRIIAVQVFEGDELGIMFDSNVAYENEEEMCEDEDNWYTIFGGMVMQNATLYSLCECIEQYV